MAEVDCEIVETELEDERTGDSREGVVAVCGNCGHETQSFGTGDPSRRRCLALMREECPEGERNFYVEA